MINWLNVLVLAVLGATATVGLKTGALGPLFPTVTRIATPKRYWLGIAVCASLVVFNIVRLMLLL